MSLIRGIEVQNFRCFRSAERVDLAQINYLVGPNNAGKSAFLLALRCFFDTTQYSPSYLNRIELSRRQAGATRSKITVDFDLTQVTSKAIQKRLASTFGNNLKIAKIFNYGEVSQTVTTEYELPNRKNPLAFDQLDEDIRKVISAVSISYLHPQQGAELLQQAREKFKARLFHNWGRHASVASQLKEAQARWAQLRTTANTYLSGALSSALERVWPGCEVSVDLPENIKDIVAISDITFRTAASLPAVALTSQGTGAQSLILYQTHFLLDGDRTLHLGQYYPIWLLEEPEAFLHADIALKLGELLASKEWLSAIQMVVSTHSPLILSASRAAAEQAQWIVVDKHAITSQKRAASFSEQEVEAIGTLMGDSNFEAYFLAAVDKKLVFLEDQRGQTKEAFETAGISVVRGLRGISELKKFANVYQSVPAAVRGHAFFVVDRDRGFDEVKGILPAKAAATKGGFERFDLSEKVSVIALPEGDAAEDLFAEYQSFVEEQMDEVLDEGLRIRSKTPSMLSNAVASLRKKAPLEREEQAIAILKKSEDVKHLFWAEVKTKGLAIAKNHEVALKHLLGL